MSDIAAQEEEKRSASPSPEPVDEKLKKKFARRYGTRSEVFDSETAEMTRGGLKKEDLVLSRTGKIVSKRKSESAKKIYEQYGFKKRVQEIKKKKKKTKKKVKGKSKK